MNYLNAFLGAIRFLTVIPAGKTESEFDFRKVAMCFPFAGAAIGAVIGVAWLGASSVFTPLFSAAVAVMALAALTGGLHLDGAADFADGLLCRGGKERSLEAMKDPRVGAMGAAMIAGILILKVSALAMFSKNILFPALVAACVAGRWSMLVPMRWFDYARPRGTGEQFSRQLDTRSFAIASLLTLAIEVAIAGPAALIVLIAAGMMAFAVGLLARRALGGVTGDVFGTVNELNEILVLAVIYALKGAP